MRLGTPRRSGAEGTDDLATGLRFTDVLFGFVLRELVIRLVDWRVQPWWVRGHLILTAVVVLGSYVGYRNSRKRADYKVRFVNLPLLRFVLDQTMVFAYFRMAITTQDVDLATNPALSARWARPETLARIDLAMLALITGCYLAWDLLGHAMARRTDEQGRHRYPQITADPVRTMMSAGLAAGVVIALAWVHLVAFTSGPLLVLQALAILSIVAGLEPSAGFGWVEGWGRGSPGLWRVSGRAVRSGRCGRVEVNRGGGGLGGGYRGLVLRSLSSSMAASTHSSMRWRRWQRRGPAAVRRAPGRALDGPRVRLAHHRSSGLIGVNSPRGSLRRPLSVRELRAESRQVRRLAGEYPWLRWRSRPTICAARHSRSRMANELHSPPTSWPALTTPPARMPRRSASRGPRRSSAVL